ncbi:MAG: hypothetical protein ACRDO2_03885 [Nocardioidaceae bacterium]
MLRTWAARASIVALAAATLTVVNPTTSSHAYPIEPAPLAWEPDGRVHALAAHGDRLYVAGEFTGGIAAVDAITGQLLWTSSADNTVLAIAVSEDGSRVMAGGAFLTVGGVERKRMVALNAADGSIVDNWRPRASGKVTAMAVDAGTLYVGGSFSSLSGSGLRGLAAVDVASGQRVGSFAHYIEAAVGVEDMAVGAGRLLLSGDFTTVDGQPRASVAAIDLSTHALLDWAPVRICDGCANYKAVTTDGVNAYVGSSGPGGKLAAFDLTTGAQPWPMVRTDGDVQAASMGSDGYVYIGGHFQQYVGTYQNPRTQVASVEAATGEVGPFNPVMYRNYPGIFAMVATPARLYVGGTFSGVQVNGENNHHRFLAIFAEPAPPPPPPTTTVPTTTVPTTTVPTTTVPTTTVPTTAPTPVVTMTVDANTHRLQWPQGVTVSGELAQDGAQWPGIEVELWAQRAGRAPRALTSVVSAADGTVVYAHQPAARTTYWWHVPGTDVDSDRVTVHVQPTVTIGVAQQRLAVEARTTISGLTAPSRVGTVVNLQRWTGERWAFVQSTTAVHTPRAVRAYREYTFVVSRRSSGVTLYRAVVPADDGRLRVVSAMRRVVTYDATIVRVRPSGDERVVLRNTGVVRVDLKGWSLTNRDGTSVDLPAKVVGSGKVLRIHSDRGRNDANDLYLRGPDMYGDSHDRVLLRDLAGQLMSRFRY